MDKTDGKHAFAGWQAGSPTHHTPVRGVATSWNGRSTAVGGSLVSSSSSDATRATPGQSGGRTWAQVAAGQAGQAGRTGRTGQGGRGQPQPGGTRLGERKANALEHPARPAIGTTAPAKGLPPHQSAQETKAGPPAATKADAEKAPHQPPPAALEPLPDFAQYLAACLLAQEDGLAWQAFRQLGEGWRGTAAADDAPPTPLPAPVLDGFFRAWVGEMARTPSPESRERLFVALRGLLGGSASTAHDVAPLVRHLAAVPLDRLPALAHDILGVLDREDGLFNLPAAVAQARTALAPAQRPALAVLACVHAVLLGVGTMRTEDWDAFLAAYPEAQVPEARLGARMAIDPMAAFEGETFTPEQRLELLDAVYAIPGLVTEPFIQGSFATAWGVEVTPALRLRLLDQLMQLGKAWVQPGHARVGRTILDADYRYADQPMPTPVLEQVGRWYAATLARADWDTPQQCQDFLAGEQRAVLRMPVADPKAREALLAILAAPQAQAEGQAQAQTQAPVRRADGKVETKSRTTQEALSLDDDES